MEDPFLGFGVLKFFPGVSPAESLAIATTDKLTLGLVGGHTALVVIAALECFIGVCMLAGRWMRVAIWLLALQFVGILSPLVLLPARLFGGPYHAPTLEGQYVLKDVILVAAGLVIAAAAFRGGRLVRAEDLPIAPADPQMAEPAFEPARALPVPDAGPIPTNPAAGLPQRLIVAGEIALAERGPGSDGLPAPAHGRPTPALRAG